jgi:hypothetical protein
VQDGSRWPMRFIEGINNAATNYPFVSWASVVMGSILTYGMMLARSRFSGFPFHPYRLHHEPHLSGVHVLVLHLSGLAL